MAFVGVRHWHYKTPDPQKTARWWVENFGAKIVQEDIPTNTIFLDLFGVSLKVSPHNTEGQTYPQKYGLEHIAIATGDLDNVVKKLKTSGTLFLEETKNPKSGNTVFFIETPEGFQIELS
jgi:catechol 2,3-dioxygenase-like lactoylglutathione lyase family enzyme